MSYLFDRADDLGIVIPTDPTLKKYGFGEGPEALDPDPASDWLLLLSEQLWACGVCEQIPKTGRLVTDHEHVKGWKVMPPGERRMFVRGLTCWYCNHAYLGRGITVAKAEGVVRYLRRYQAGRTA